MAEEVMRVTNISKKYKLLTSNKENDTFASVMLNSFKGGLRKNGNKDKEFWALKDINFTVNKGDKIGIIGHNGAGKSTLLKIFSRITVPTTGEIKVKGRISSLLEVGTGFHMELTGRENIYLNGSILGMSKEEIDSKFDNIVEFSEVGKFIDTPVKKYSSGMFVKLAFAVSANLDPDILIVDEVLAVGDMKFQEKCLGKMSDVANDGRTVVYVSHSMRTIQQLCNRVIVMEHGQVIFDGDVDEGVKIYMNNNMDINSFVDFTNQERQSHVNKNAMMISSKIINNDECKFKSKDELIFDLRWKSYKKMDYVKLRAEVLYSDNTPAGASFSFPINNIKEDEDYIDRFRLDISQLAPGKYTVIFVLYQVNKFGTYSDIDRVEHGLNFEIIDEYTDENIEWTHRWWGHIMLPKLERI